MVFTPRFFSTPKSATLRTIILNGKTIVADKTSLASQGASFAIDIQKPREWSPTDPFLYGVKFTLLAYNLTHSCYFNERSHAHVSGSLITIGDIEIDIGNICALAICIIFFLFLLKEGLEEGFKGAATLGILIVGNA